jgi:hypothetical protein
MFREMKRSSEANEFDVFPNASPSRYDYMPEAQQLYVTKPFILYAK